MKLGLVFAVACLLYLPTTRYGFVQDDRAIIAGNPAAHTIGSAVQAFGQPYWPRPAEGGLYRPLTILTFAVDWSLSGGRAGWLHFINAVLHGLVAVLVVLVLERWSAGGPMALAAGLVFAVHPVHVEGVASLVSRGELLAAIGILGAILAARRGWWVAALGCALAAMLSKEHGVVVGVAILLDDWLRGQSVTRYPALFYLALGIVTAAYLVTWNAIGGAGAADVAPPFLGTSTGSRLLLAGSAIATAGRLLVWPAALSADYNPRVLIIPSGVTISMISGWMMVIGMPLLIVWAWKRAPAVAFAAGLAALSYLPTANLLFPSGVVLAERNLYLAVTLVGVLLGMGVEEMHRRWGGTGAGVILAAVVVACAGRSWSRLPAWRDNRSQLLTLLQDHPESYRAHASAAAVLAGTGDTTGARRQYELADSLFDGDPHLDAARALYLVDRGDTATAATLAEHARTLLPRERNALRVQFLLARGRGDVLGAAAIADTAGRWYPQEREWYIQYLQ